MNPEQPVRFLSQRRQLKAKRLQGLIEEQAIASLEQERVLDYDAFVEYLDAMQKKYGYDHLCAVIDRMREIDPSTEA